MKRFSLVIGFSFLLASSAGAGDSNLSESGAALVTVVGDIGKDLERIEQYARGLEEKTPPHISQPLSDVFSKLPEELDQYQIKVQEVVAENPADIERFAPFFKIPDPVKVVALIVQLKAIELPAALMDAKPCSQKAFESQACPKELGPRLKDVSAALRTILGLPSEGRIPDPKDLRIFVNECQTPNKTNAAMGRESAQQCARIQLKARHKPVSSLDLKKLKIGFASKSLESIEGGAARQVAGGAPGVQAPRSASQSAFTGSSRDLQSLMSQAHKTQVPSPSVAGSIADVFHWVNAPSRLGLMSGVAFVDSVWKTKLKQEDLKDLSESERLKVMSCQQAVVDKPQLAPWCLADPDETMVTAGVYDAMKEQVIGPSAVKNFLVCSAVMALVTASIGTGGVALAVSLLIGLFFGSTMIMQIVNSYLPRLLAAIAAYKAAPEGSEGDATRYYYRRQIAYLWSTIIVLGIFAGMAFYGAGNGAVKGYRALADHAAVLRAAEPSLSPLRSMLQAKVLTPEQLKADVILRARQVGAGPMQSRSMVQLRILKAAKIQGEDLAALVRSGALSGAFAPSLEGEPVAVGMRGAVFRLRQLGEQAIEKFRGSRESAADQRKALMKKDLGASFAEMKKAGITHLILYDFPIEKQALLDQYLTSPHTGEALLAQRSKVAGVLAEHLARSGESTSFASCMEVIDAARGQGGGKIKVIALANSIQLWPDKGEEAWVEEILREPNAKAVSLHNSSVVLEGSESGSDAKMAVDRFAEHYASYRQLSEVLAASVGLKFTEGRVSPEVAQELQRFPSIEGKSLAELEQMSVERPAKRTSAWMGAELAWDMNKDAAVGAMRLAESTEFKTIAQSDASTAQKLKMVRRLVDSFKPLNDNILPEQRLPVARELSSRIVAKEVIRRLESLPSVAGRTPAEFTQQRASIRPGLFASSVEREAYAIWLEESKVVEVRLAGAVSKRVEIEVGKLDRHIKENAAQRGRVFGRYLENHSDIDPWTAKVLEAYSLLPDARGKSYDKLYEMEGGVKPPGRFASEMQKQAFELWKQRLEEARAAALIGEGGNLGRAYELPRERFFKTISDLKLPLDVKKDLVRELMSSTPDSAYFIEQNGGRDARMAEDLMEFLPKDNPSEATVAALAGAEIIRGQIVEQFQESPRVGNREIYHASLEVRGHESIEMARSLELGKYVETTGQNMHQQSQQICAYAACFNMLTSEGALTKLIGDPDWETLMKVLGGKFQEGDKVQLCGKEYVVGGLNYHRVWSVLEGIGKKIGMRPVRVPAARLGEYMADTGRPVYVGIATEKGLSGGHAILVGDPYVTENGRGINFRTIDSNLLPGEKGIMPADWLGRIMGPNGIGFIGEVDGPVLFDKWTKESSDVLPAALQVHGGERESLAPTGQKAMTWVAQIESKIKLQIALFRQQAAVPAEVSGGGNLLSPVPGGGFLDAVGARFQELLTPKRAGEAVEARPGEAAPPAAAHATPIQDVPVEALQGWKGHVVKNLQISDEMSPYNVQLVEMEDGRRLVFKTWDTYRYGQRDSGDLRSMSLAHEADRSARINAVLRNAKQGEFPAGVAIQEAVLRKVKGQDVLVSEYIPGYTLQDVLSGKADFRLSVEDLKPLDDFMETLHRKGYVHGDVHAGNIKADKDLKTGKVEFKFLDTLTSGEKANNVMYPSKNRRTGAWQWVSEVDMSWPEKLWAKLTSQPVTAAERENDSWAQIKNQFALGPAEGSRPPIRRSPQSAARVPEEVVRANFAIADRQVRKAEIIMQLDLTGLRAPAQAEAVLRAHEISCPGGVCGPKELRLKYKELEKAGLSSDKIRDAIERGLAGGLPSAEVQEVPPTASVASRELILGDERSGKVEGFDAPAALSRPPPKSAATERGFSRYFEQGEFPPYFLPREYRNVPAQDIPAPVIQRQVELLEQAVASVLRRVTLPVVKPGETQAHLVRYFDYVEPKLKAQAPAPLSVMASGGVVRSTIGYLYYLVEQRLRMEPGVEPDQVLREVIADGQDLHGLQIRGVGSDWDMLLRLDMEPGAAKDAAMARLTREALEATNSAEAHYDMSAAKGAVKRGLFAVGDVKDYESQTQRAARQGGSTIDLLAFDVEKGKFVEPSDYPGIVENMVRGRASYVKPQASAAVEDAAKQTVRGLRVFLELPFLSLQNEDTLRAELSGLLEKMKSGDAPSPKAREQFDKMIRNARYGGAHNRFYRAQPGTIEELALFVAEGLRSQKNRAMLPEFVDHFLLEGRDGSELHGLPEQLVVHSLPAAKFYHGTPSAENGLAILRGGLFLSKDSQGVAVYGRGAYASPAIETAQGHAGSSGVVFELELKKGRRVNILDWEAHKDDPKIKEIAAQAKAQGRDAFEFLAREHGIDIIINQHILIENAEAVQFPAGYKGLVTTYAHAALDEKSPISSRKLAYDQYRRLHEYAQALHETGLPEPEAIRAGLVAGLSGKLADAKAPVDERIKSAAQLWEFGEKVDLKSLMALAGLYYRGESKLTHTQDIGSWETMMQHLFKFAASEPGGIGLLKATLAKEMNTTIRADAAMVLGRMGTKEAVAALLQAVSEKNAEFLDLSVMDALVQPQALQFPESRRGLVKTYSHAVLDEKVSLDRRLWAYGQYLHWYEYAKALRETDLPGPESVRVGIVAGLVDNLADRNIPIDKRIERAAQLWQFGGKADFKTLMDLAGLYYKDKNRLTRAYGIPIEAMMHQLFDFAASKPGGCEFLQTILAKERNESIRADAAMVLGRMGTKEAVAALLQAAYERAESEKGRAIFFPPAIEALAQLQALPPEAVLLVEKCLPKTWDAAYGANENREEAAAAAIKIIRRFHLEAPEIRVRLSNLAGFTSMSRMMMENQLAAMEALTEMRQGIGIDSMRNLGDSFYRDADETTHLRAMAIVEALDPLVPDDGRLDYQYRGMLRHLAMKNEPRIVDPAKRILQRREARWSQWRRFRMWREGW